MHTLHLQRHELIHPNCPFLGCDRAIEADKQPAGRYCYAGSIVIWCTWDRRFVHLAGKFVFFCWHRNIRSVSLSSPAATGSLSFWLGSAERGIFSSHGDKRTLHVSYWNRIRSIWLDVLRYRTAGLPCPTRVIDFMSAACIIIRIPIILRNPRVHCRVHNSSPLSQINPVDVLRLYFFKIHFNIFFPCASKFFKVVAFLRIFLWKLCVSLFPVPATYLNHVISCRGGLFW
jgi:hypothetical protein